jgi:carbamoyltransferase
MTNDKFAELFGGPARTAETDISQREMDIAASIQKVTEEVVLRLARTLHKETGVDHLCLAGGVALNCVANGRIEREGPFKSIWIQPAAGDAGGALGAASVIWHEYLGNERESDGTDKMKGSYLGPRYERDEIKSQLDSTGAVYKELSDEELFPRLAEILDTENVIGWMRGRMEFGPRALGGRSIIGDPRSAKMQSVMNLKIKYRESFRPFAPSVIDYRVSDYFEQQTASPYMLIVAPVKEEHRIELT